MRLAQLQERILRLTAQRPVPRRTVMRQCLLAGNDPLQVTDTLIELLDAGLIGLHPKFDGHGVELGCSYSTTIRGIEQLNRGAA